MLGAYTKSGGSMDKQVGALIAAALYKSRLFEGEPSIDEGTFDSCQKAARWRIDYLSLLRDRKLPIASVSDLAWASTVIDVMACRVLSQAGADYVQDKHPLCWYESYCGSVLQFSMAMQQAVQDGRLTLRDHLSRVPLRGDDLAYWRDVDLTYVSKCGPLVPDCAGWDGDPTYWPDGLVTPPGAITVQEAEQWATGAGLTEPGELPRLLGLSLPEEAASGGDDQAAPAVEETGIVAPTTWRELVQFRVGKKGTGFKSEEKRIVANEKARRSNQPGAKGVAAAMAEELDISVTLLNSLVRTAPKANWADPVNGNRKGSDKAA